METSEEKTRRKLINYFSLYQWNYQYSFFRVDGDEDPSVFLSDAAELKTLIRSRNRKTPIFCVIRLKRHRTGHTDPYITCFSPHELNYVDSAFNELTRTICEKDILRQIKALKTQKLHNLTNFFGEGFKGYKRFAVINRSKLIPLAQKLTMEPKDY